ncbi:MAG TPA: class I SAM-dependent methyltransferase [Stellaceae bacterium]|jgi:SAM-dependent methyltransferase|nr:class I SAM-dependent methyltransferase [Stellaceae bacterium]
MPTETGRSLAEIEAYWREAASAETDADGLRPTARDPFLQEAVETAIERHLSGGDRLLDVGCGDGASTLRFAGRVREAVGIDYIDTFVSRASAASAQRGIGNVRFRQASVLDLSELRRAEGVFDVAVSIRCLINLPEVAQQAKGIAEIAASVRSGGCYLASEGWEEGMRGLNRLREAAGLPAIKTVSYNLLLPRAVFEAEAKQHFEIDGYHSLGFYLFMSRVVQPLVVAPEAPRHDHRINQVAVQLSRILNRSEFRDCDYAGVYVLRRR